MSLEAFRERCNCSKIYFFKTVKKFDEKIDWNNKSVKGITFVRGIVDDREYPPYCFSAYGTDMKKLEKILIN